MKKYAYYRDGTLPIYIVRLAIDGDSCVAEAWDYKNEKWVPDADAWETILDQRGNWDLDEDYWEEYAKKMIDRFPKTSEFSPKPKPDGATRKYPWW